MLLNIFLPFFNFILISCCGRILGKMGTIYCTIYCFIYLMFCNIQLFYFLITTNNIVYINLGSWLEFSILHISWEFMIDNLSICMLLMVSIISFLVHIYSFVYMKFDPHFIRFISYLSIFTFFMCILVTANSFIQLFVGWEGVGLCSYLLINFWFTRLQANKAALKALFMNKIGDIGFLIAAVFIFFVFRTFDFTILNVLTPIFSESLAIIFHTNFYTFTVFDIICFCLIIGIVGKSAQLGLHTWLPSAMEGPTPVSALIHAATMVTAGIFLLIRTSFLFEYSYYIQNLIIIIGACTAFISAITAIFLYDIKKIIAYSTCSQLGYMLLAAGLSQYTLSFFHLINHAFFKALLFLTAGAIIHSFNNEQDIRKINGIFFKMPFIYSAVLIGNIAIMGLPFLTGFYSKDLIIEIVYVNTIYKILGLSISGSLIFWIIMLATACTAIYSLRLYYFLFLRQNVVIIYKNNVKELIQPLYIQLVLFFLMMGSIFIGYILSDLFALNNYIFEFNKYIFNNFNYFFNYFYLENEYLKYYIKLMPLICNLFVVLLFYFLINFYQQRNINYSDFLLKTFGSNKYFLNCYFDFLKIVQNNFYFNEFYNYLTLFNYYYYYKHIFLNIDKGFIEFIGPTKVAHYYSFFAFKLHSFFKQSITKHLFIIYNTLLIYFFLIEFIL
jgi:NADH-ubiquinone oxidoreductase chain 5